MYYFLHVNILFFFDHDTMIIMKLKLSSYVSCMYLKMLSISETIKLYRKKKENV